jgi:hypothetical protein
MVLKVLIYRGLDVLSFYIPSQHNIAYHYKHNMRYNQEKTISNKHVCSNQPVVIINYPLLVYKL